MQSFPERKPGCCLQFILRKPSARDLETNFLCVLRVLCGNDFDFYLDSPLAAPRSRNQISFPSFG